MLEFMIHGILWTLALYGLFEIVKTILCIVTCTKMKSDGIYMMIATKNQENKIEGFLRTILFRILYGKEEMIKNIMVVDLGSTDDTIEILHKMEKDYPYIKVTNWREYKELMENINSN